MSFITNDLFNFLLQFFCNYLCFLSIYANWRIRLSVLTTIIKIKIIKITIIKILNHICSRVCVFLCTNSWRNSFPQSKKLEFREINYYYYLLAYFFSYKIICIWNAKWNLFLIFCDLFFNILTGTKHLLVSLRLSNNKRSLYIFIKSEGTNEKWIS